MHELIRNDIYHLAHNMEYLHTDGSTYKLGRFAIDDNRAATIIRSEGDLLEIEETLVNAFSCLREDVGLVVQVMVEANRSLGLGFMKYFPVSCAIREMDKIRLPLLLKAVYLDKIANYYIDQIGCNSSYILKAPARYSREMLKPLKNLDLNEIENLQLTTKLTVTTNELSTRRYKAEQTHTYISLMQYTEYDLVTGILESVPGAVIKRKLFEKTANLTDENLENVIRDLYENSGPYTVRLALIHVMEVYIKYPIHTPKYAEEVEDYYMYRDIESLKSLHRKLLDRCYV